jgi:DNA polymerase IV
VKVKFADFHQVIRSRSFATPVVGRDLLCQTSVDLVRTLLRTALGVRLIGITVPNLDQRRTTKAD